MISKHIYSVEDKEKWFKKGPWCDEPDHVTFDHMGLKCEVKRVVVFEQNGDPFGGHLCGYVHLPENHSLYGKKRKEFIDVDVNGGLTYFEYEDKDFSVGFDCAHSHDLIPSMKDFYERLDSEKKYPKLFIFNATYKDIDFVVEETKNLAQQISNHDIIPKKA